MIAEDLAAALELLNKRVIGRADWFFYPYLEVEMYMKRIRTLAGLLLALALPPLLAGCRRSSHTGRASGSHQDIQNITDTVAYTYDLPEEAVEFSLSLDIRPRGGALPGKF